MGGAGGLGGVIIEAVVVQERAAATQVSPSAQRGAQLGRQYRAAGPVEQRVFEKVVAHPLLDRRQPPTMTVRIDKARQQQLATVAENACARGFRLQRRERAGGGGRVASR